jgi:hypothetical protein
VTSVKTIARVALAMGLALPASAAADPPHKLFVYGDSFAVGTMPFLPTDLPDWRVRQDVAVARPADSAIPVLKAKENLPAVIHISLGTFGDRPAKRPFRRAVRRTMRAAEGSCVVWANIFRTRHPTVLETENYWHPLNDVLDQEAARRDNLIVVDWASMVERHLDWRLGDGAHVTVRGYRARARAVAQGVLDCYERIRLRGTS